MVDAVLKYEGHVDRFLGDGVLAVFGLFQAHEDDAERAIRAGLEIREAARKLGLEVTGGINTGNEYGIGDISLLGNFVPYMYETKKATFRWAVTGGRRVCTSPPWRERGCSGSRCSGC